MDNAALKNACFKAARAALWQTPHPQDISDIIDTDQIERLSQCFYEIAAWHIETTESLNCDPNLITRAVLYLAYVHAIPPMKEDTRWFKEMLHVLVELACPNITPTEEAAQFLIDIEQGIKIARQSMEENAE